MKRSHLLLIVLLVFSLVASSCSGDDPVPGPGKNAARTILVYMAANNDLGRDGFDEQDLIEMQDAATAGAIPRNTRWIIYHAPYGGGKPSLIEITQQGKSTLKEYQDDMLSVDSRRMSEVFADAAAVAPADQWGLIFWSHASGWTQDGISRGGTPAQADEPQCFSYGADMVGNSTYKMNISDLADVISKAPFRPEFIYFDCCYMASIESLYDLRHVTPYIIGSATELPAKGMPYDVNVAHFMKMPEADIFAAAASTFAYYDALSGSSRTCTMSIVATEALDDLAATTRAIYSNFDGKMPEGYHPQCFQSRSEENCIYFDFKDYIHAICTDSALLADFDEAFDRAVLYSAATPNLWYYTKLDRHNGVSTYILRDESSKAKYDYSTLAWYKDVASAINFRQ